MDIDAATLKRLRREAAERAITNNIQSLVDEQARIIKTTIRERNRLAGASIDSSMTRAKISTERAVTAQTTYDRRSLFDHAETNPVLARVLRRIQDATHPQ